jgi:hypothetical protein
LIRPVLILVKEHIRIDNGIKGEEIVALNQFLFQLVVRDPSNIKEENLGFVKDP